MTDRPKFNLDPVAVSTLIREVAEAMGLTLPNIGGRWNARAETMWGTLRIVIETEYVAPFEDPEVPHAVGCECGECFGTKVDFAEPQNIDAAAKKLMKCQQGEFLDHLIKDDV